MESHKTRTRADVVLDDRWDFDPPLERPPFPNMNIVAFRLSVHGGETLSVPDGGPVLCTDITSGHVGGARLEEAHGVRITE